MAGFFINLFDFVMNIDVHLGQIIGNYGTLTYLFIFAIVFLETGFVLTPFLPGDSLLFAAGAFAALGDLNVFLLFALVSLASILGDSANYWIGNYFGEKFFSGNRFFKKEYLERTKEFYRKHGGETIILARFVPIVRTFAPFVAGVGRMNYSRFLYFNVIGGILWAALFVFAGYFFGGLKFVQDNFSLVVLAIIVISLVPLVYEVWKSRK